MPPPSNLLLLEDPDIAKYGFVWNITSMVVHGLLFCCLEREHIMTHVLTSLDRLPN